MTWSGGNLRARTQGGVPTLIRNTGRFTASGNGTMMRHFSNTQPRFENAGALNIDGTMNLSGWRFEQSAGGSLGGRDRHSGRDA